jgi:translocator protein
MPHPSKRHKTLGLAACLGLSFLTAGVGAAASVNAAAFYAQLLRPAWAPPAWAFGPVWSVLFTMMAVAAWLVWCEQDAPQRKLALTLFVSQLVANALWSWFFFAWRLGAWAFADALLMWVLIAATTALFWSIRRLAAVLMLPYLAWVSLAIALTWSTWRTNPALLG